MVTTHRQITLGQSFLQGIWTETQGENNNARNFPDRRLSVCETGCVTKDYSDKKPASGSGKPHSSSDSLLGSLLAESFAGAVFGPLLPLWAQGIDWSNAIEAADTVWMDRREAAPRPRLSGPLLGLF